MLSDYTPMAPTQVRQPFHRDGWIYEEKLDGWRMLAYKDNGRVRLVSRNGRDHTRRFRDLAAAVAKLSSRTLVLDGEVAIFDEKFRSRFEWLRAPDRDAIATPPMFIAFYLLYRNGRELTGRKLRERRARLEDVVANVDLVLVILAIYVSWATGRRQRRVERRHREDGGSDGVLELSEGEVIRFPAVEEEPHLVVVVKRCAAYARLSPFFISSRPLPRSR